MFDNLLTAVRPLARIRILQKILILFCKEKTWSNRINTNIRRILPGHMDRQPLSEVGNSGLGSGICRNPSQRTKGIHGGNIQNHSRTLLCHDPAKHLTRYYCSQKIEIANRSKRFFWKIKK